MIEAFVLEHYKNYLVSSRTCKSQVSIDDYVLSLDMFCREAGDNILETVTEYRQFHWVFERLALRESWDDGRKKRKWGDRMLYKTATECIVFFRWAYAFNFTKNKIPLDSPKVGHMFKKSDDVPPEFFEWASIEFQRLLHHPANTMRDHAMLHTLRASGVRISECCNLTISDVDLESEILKIRQGKGGKDGFAPLDEQARELLTKHIDCLVKMGYSPSDPLFPASIKSKTPYREGSARKWIYNRGRDLGIRAYPHKIRHSLAGELLERGADLLTIAETLRHKDLNTTKRYEHMTPARMKRMYDRLIKNPTANELNRAS